MGDNHDKLCELHETFIGSQVEILPISVTRTSTIDRFSKDLEVYMKALIDRAEKRNSLIWRGDQYSKLLETEAVDRPANYDDQIKEAKRQRGHAKNILKES